MSERQTDRTNTIPASLCIAYAQNAICYVVTGTMSWPCSSTSISAPVDSALEPMKPYQDDAVYDEMPAMYDEPPTYDGKNLHLLTLNSSFVVNKLLTVIFITHQYIILYNFFSSVFSMMRTFNIHIIRRARARVFRGKHSRLAHRQ